MKKPLFFLASIATALATAPVHAATLLVDANGILTGAAGVEINGSMFDVSFLDGSCVDLFNGCDEVSDFVFSFGGDASRAATALFEQVFIDGPSGNFDTHPEATNGCTDTVRCIAIIPYAVDNNTLSIGYADNYSVENLDTNKLSRTSRTHDQSVSSAQVYAVFQESAGPAVPEPATWAMMIIGFGLIGSSLRRRITNVKVSYA